MMTGLKCLLGGSVLLVMFQLLRVSFDVPVVSIPYLLSVGAFSIAFSILLFLIALREIGSMQTGVIFSTSSLFDAVFALAILKEPFSLTQFIAGLIMLFGVCILYRK